MNWEHQHLPWKVTEPQIDGSASPDIPAPRVLDASLALPRSGFNLPLPPWQNVRRADGILELRVPGKELDHYSECKPRLDIDDEPTEDDAWIIEAFNRFDQIKLDEPSFDEDHLIFTEHYNPDLSHEELPDYDHLGDKQLDRMVGRENRKKIREIKRLRRTHAAELRGMQGAAA
jgi:hypothetical protein